MIQVYLGGILMVLGMVAIIAQPILGVAMIGGGYFLYQKSSSIQRHDATSLFFGFCLLCGAITTVVGLLSMIF